MSSDAGRLKGVLLAGRYRVETELGRGASGAVYHAVDTRDGTDVAVKVLLESAQLARFRREVEAVARLDHPAIVRTLGTAEHKGLPIVVMELVVGESLDARLRREKRLDVVEAVGIARAVVAALEHAHAKGVVHRDLKPSNVLLDGDGRPRLADFGLAKVQGAASLTGTHAIVGTPVFMSPEQANADECGPATDVYGAGALLHALLSGEPPFTGESFEELLRKLLLEPPRPLGALRPDVPPAVEALVLRCLEKDPARRFESAAALGRALDVCLDDPPPPPRRGALLLGLGLVAAALAVLCAAALVRSSARERDRARAAEERATAERLEKERAAAAQRAAAAKRRDAARDAAERSLRAATPPQEHRRIEQELSAALEAYPGDPELLRLRGRARAALGDKAGFEADLAKAIEQRPKDAAGWLLRADGRALPGIDDEQGALLDVGEALALDPANPMALRLQGTIFCRRGSLREGVALLERSLERDPSALVGWQALCDAALRGGDLVRARRAHERERELAADLSTTLFHDAQLAMVDGRVADAKLDLDAVVASGAVEAEDARYLRGRVRIELGDLEGARDDLRRALATHASDPLGWETLGDVAYRLQGFDEAREAYTKAIALAPSAYLHHRRGLCREAAGDRAGAREDQARAASLPGDPPASRAAREALERLRD